MNGEKMVVKQVRDGEHYKFSAGGVCVWGTSAEVHGETVHVFTTEWVGSMGRDRIVASFDNATLQVEP